MLYNYVYHGLSTLQPRGGLGDSEMEIPTLQMRYGSFVTGVFLMGIVRLNMITSVPP